MSTGASGTPPGVPVWAPFCAVRVFALPEESASDVEPHAWSKCQSARVLPSARKGFVGTV